MRRVIRWILSTVAVGLVVAVLYGMVGEFFIEWAREKGWYDRPSERVDAAMNALTLFVTQTWFVSMTALFVGLAVGVWLDALLRRRNAKVQEPRREPVGQTDAALSARRRQMITIADKVFMNEKVILDGFEYVKCTFINCTFVYNSVANFSIKDPKIKGILAITSDNPAIDNAINLLYQLGLLRIGIVDRASGEYLAPKPKFIGEGHDPEKGTS